MMVAICAWCNRIRTKQGQFVDIDYDVDTFAPGMVTHTECPSCIRKHRSEIADRILAPAPDERPLS